MTTHTERAGLVLAALLTGALALAGCGTSDARPAASSGAAAAGQTAPGTDGPAVLTSVYPLQYVTARVAGDHADVTPVTAQRGDAHGVELAPHDVVAIEQADLVVHLSGLQPALDDAVTVTGVRALDVAGPAELLEADGEAHDHDHGGDHEGHDHGGLDPHFWLDPQRLATVTGAIADELAALDPDAAEDYRAGAAAVVADLEALDAEYEAGLASCSSSTIVVGHEAYGYLADRFGLDQEGIAGLDPEVEPSPVRLAEIADVVAAEGVRTIFVESEVAPGVARTLADELGVRTAVLDPLELQQDEGTDYLGVMRANLAALREALGCAR